MAEPWTLGPWTTDYAGDPPMPRVLHSNNEWVIATMGRSGEGGRANARLIALAPEMAEMLASLTVLFPDEVWSVPLKDGIDLDLQLIRNLLARARGES